MSFLDQFESAGIAEGAAAFREAVRWREKRSPSQWASEVRKIAAGQSPLSTGQVIPYRHEVMPHCVEQMDAADDPSIRIIALWGPIRDGKTNSTCLNVVGRTVTDDPGNIYSVHPTDDDAAKFSNDDVEGIIGACLEAYFVAKKSRDSGRTVGYKKFVGGSIRIVSAGSITKFRGTSVKVMLLHELDKLNPVSIFQAFGRTTGFADAVIIVEGTGTIAATYDPDGKKIYHSRIEEFYDKGDKRKWFGPCRVCDALQWLKYESFAWPAGHMAKAVMLCERCGAAHNEKQWRDFQYAAKWFPTAGLTPEQEKDIAAHYRKARAIDPTVRSYWRNGFNRVGLPVSKGFKTALHEIVAKGESAKTSVSALQIWRQEEAAELWDPASEGEAPPPWKPIADRREDYGLIVPMGGLYLTCFCDLQLTRIEVGWRAWGRNEQSWGMDHVVLDGHIREPEVWQKLRHELARKFLHASGAELRLGFGFIDGGTFAEDLYRFFQRLARDPVPGVNGHVRASKGVGQHGHPIITQKMMTIAKNLKGHHIGTWEAKDRIYERLRMVSSVNGSADELAPMAGDLDRRPPRDANTPSASPDYSVRAASNIGAQRGSSSPPVHTADTREGWMHFNRSYSEEYFQQLTVETVTITFEKGVEVRKYVNPQQQRNEALDIEVGNLAAFRLRPMTENRWAAIEAEIAEQVKELKGARPTTTEPRPLRIPTSSRGGLGRGWNV